MIQSTDWLAVFSRKIWMRSISSPGDSRQAQSGECKFSCSAGYLKVKCFESRWQCSSDGSVREALLVIWLQNFMAINIVIVRVQRSQESASILSISGRESSTCNWECQLPLLKGRGFRFSFRKAGFTAGLIHTINLTLVFHLAATRPAALAESMERKSSATTHRSFHFLHLYSCWLNCKGGFYS